MQDCPYLIIRAQLRPKSALLEKSTASLHASRLTSLSTWIEDPANWINTLS